MTAPATPGAGELTRWTNARLDALRQMGDPDVDPVVRAAYDEGGPAALGRITRQLDDWEAPLPDDLPVGLRDYFATPVVYPSWVDQSQLRHAEDLFTAFGPLTLSTLLLNSYPHFLTCPAGARAMYNARLFSPEAVASRMLELAQFSIFMGERHGLSIDAGHDYNRHGRSFVAYRKLRVIHANLRLILTGPAAANPWDTQGFGVVVNQEDLALAMLCFGVSTIDGLQKTGFDLSAADQEAMLMGWRTAGWLLGLVDELQPRDFQEAIFSLISGTYSPGTVSALVLFVPAGLWAFVGAQRDGVLNRRVIITAVLIAVGIHVALLAFHLVGPPGAGGAVSQRTSLRSSTKIAYSTGTRTRVTSVATVSPPIWV